MSRSNKDERPVVVSCHIVRKSLISGASFDGKERDQEKERETWAMSQITKNIKIPEPLKNHLITFWDMGTVPAPRYLEVGIFCGMIAPFGQSVNQIKSVWRKKEEGRIKGDRAPSFCLLLFVLPRC